MKTSFWLLLLLCPIFLLAQNKDNYLPFSYKNTKAKENLIQEIETRYLSDIQLFNKKRDKEIIEVYTNRKESLIDKINNNEFYFDPSITDYFQHIFDEILTANPDLKTHHPRLLISKSPYSNASCLGEGTVVFNLDLLTKMDNESQLAFILCHELAHQASNHVNNSIKKRINIINSDEYQRKIKDISKQEYNQYQSVLEFLKENVFSDRYHSRQHESEADALGLQYLKNTKYNVDAAAECLLRLETINEEQDSAKLITVNLKKHFNSEDYPFKDRWLGIEDVFKFDDNDEIEWDADSLKTHPDCLARKNKLDNILMHYHTDKAQHIHIQSIDEFELLQKRGEFERVENYFLHSSNMGVALLETLILLKKYPNEAYLHGMIGRIFYRLHQARKEHRLSKVTDRQSPYFSDAYNLVLDFIYNLRMSEIGKVGFYYIQNVKELYGNQEDILWAEYLMANIIENTNIKNSLKRTYQEIYPDGKYIEILKTLEEQ